MALLAQSVAEIALAINVHPPRFAAVIDGARPVDGELDLRLSRYFRMSDGFFLGLQTDYELLEAKRALNPNTVFSPHGVDVDLFAKAQDPATGLPALARDDGAHQARSAAADHDDIVRCSGSRGWCHRDIRVVIRPAL